MKRGCIIDLVDWTTDILSVSTPVLNALGIPITPHSTIIIGKSIKMLLQFGMPKLFKDYQSRQLSPMQKDRLEEVKAMTIKTVYDLIDKDGWEEIHPESTSYTQNVIEYSESLINHAINESRQAKRMILGVYLGSTLYTLNSSSPKWDNVFYLSSLIERLTIRQIILLKLIVENFSEISDSEKELMCITNKVAISELKELESRNMWVGLTKIMTDPTYMAIPLKYMCPTDLTKELVGTIHIPEALQEYMKDIIKSLDFKPYAQSDLAVYYSEKGGPDPFRHSIIDKLNMIKNMNNN